MKIRIIPTQYVPLPSILEIFPSKSLKGILAFFFQLHGIPFSRDATIYLPSANQVCFQSFAFTSNATINNLYIHFHLFCKKNYFHFYRQFLSSAFVPRHYKFKIIAIANRSHYWGFSFLVIHSSSFC